jgi:hypothetical protein
MEMHPKTHGQARPETRGQAHPHLTDGRRRLNTQLAQVRELEAQLVEEYWQVRLLRATIAGEASARGERVRELGKQAREYIDADFNFDNPNTLPRASQKLVAAATLL